MAHTAHPQSARRPNARRHPAHDHSATRLVLFMIGVLATLAALGWAGSNMYRRANQQRALVTMMGAKGNFAPLPELELTLGGARSLDLKVTLELKPKANPAVADRYSRRIVDRLYDDIRQHEPEELLGPGSANLVKQSVTRAVRGVTGQDMVKDVLIERMIVK